MATSNRIRALNRLPFDFDDGLKIGGVDVSSLNQVFGPGGAALIGVTPVGGLNSANVQAALVELDAEKARLDALAANNSTFGSSLVGHDGGSVKDVLDTAKPMANYTALRAYTGTATHVRITSNGISGFFYYDATDTTSTDNGGTVIVQGSTVDGNGNITSGNGKRWKRLFDGSVNVLWFGADRSGLLDSSLGFQAAVNYSKTLTGGGSVYAPAGTYSVTGIDLSNASSDYTRSLRIFGDGPRATKIVLNTGGVGIDCIGRPHVKIENLLVTSGSLAPSVGILFARSATARSIMNSTMRNVQVEGNFTQACVASIACETFAIFDCTINNTNTSGGVAWYTGSGPTGRKHDATGAYVNFTVSSVLGSIQTDANTSISFYRTNLLCYGDYGTPLSIDSVANASFFGCEFIPTTPGAKQCVLLSDNAATPFNGPLNFFGCLFESQYSDGIVAHSTRNNPSFNKINVTSCNFVLFGTGQESINYGAGHTGDLAFVQLNYKDNSRPTSQTDSIRIQYLNRSDINMPNGNFSIYTASLNSRLLGTRQLMRSAELIAWTNNQYYLGDVTIKPISGVFFKGERVNNSDPATGEYIGWVASTENGAAWSVTRVNSTNYAVGTWIRDVATSGNPVYEVTATSGTGLTGAAPPTKPASIGNTVVDGELTLTLRANRATTMLPYGVVA